MSTCRFDDSLPWFVELLTAEIGNEQTAAGVVLRDAIGQLAFFLNAELDESKLESISRKAETRLGPYARRDRLIVPQNAPGAAQILNDSEARLLNVREVQVRYLDRRIVGADWLRQPAAVRQGPLRLVFSSLKGGVGRSTALSVVAAEWARRSRNVLVVDLDVEAPGVGSLLLGDDRLPTLGVLDYLVERNLGAIDRSFLELLVGTSGATSGAGLVDVVPVVGSRSLDQPQNYLAKLSRAVLEAIGHTSAPASFADNVANMLAELENRRTYDLVLIDARAGLAEVTAAPLLALGANILLFGTSQRQTIQGLKFLFSHMSSLIEPGQSSPWQGLKMVHAKAQLASDHGRFRDDLWDLFSEYIYEEQEGIEGFNFDVDAPDAPHNPIAIPLDLAFADWDPASQPGKLVDSYYDRTFGALLQYVEDLSARRSET